MNENNTPPAFQNGPSPAIVTPSNQDSVLDLTFLKLAVHAQQHRSDCLLATNNGAWVLLAAGGEKIERATRAITPVVEHWKYNDLANREMKVSDTLLEAVEWMASVGNECFHVIMELPILKPGPGLADVPEEGEIEVMYALGIRGENEVRSALKNAGLL